MARKKSYAQTEETTTDTVATTTTSIPPCPAAGPFGDLTPAVVEWYRDYHPEEFERRYIRPGHPKGPRKTHLDGLTCFGSVTEGSRK